MSTPFIFIHIRSFLNDRTQQLTSCGFHWLFAGGVLLGWSPSQRKDAMSQVALLAVISVAVGRGCQLFIAQMSRDSVDGLARFIGHNVLIFNTRNYPDRTTAAPVDFNVYIEYALEPLRPGHMRAIAMSQRSLEFEPGSKWACCNSGITYALLSNKARSRSGEMLSLDKEFRWKPGLHAKTLQMNYNLEKFIPHVLAAALHSRCGTVEDDQYRVENAGAFDTPGLGAITEIVNNSAIDLINGGVKKISRSGVKKSLMTMARKSKTFHKVGEHRSTG